jgi:hypothetical protein
MMMNQMVTNGAIPVTSAQLLGSSARSNCSSQNAPNGFELPLSKIQHSRNTRECSSLKNANVGKSLLADSPCDTRKTWPDS